MYAVKSAGTAIACIAVFIVPTQKVYQHTFVPKQADGASPRRGVRRVSIHTLHTPSVVCTEMAMATPYVGDMDMSKIVFGPCEIKDGKTKVEVYRDGTSTANNNKINKLALCKDAMVPMETRFSLDNVREDSGNPYRRGLGITVTDPNTIRALRALDEVIVKAAIANSKDWFKKKEPLSEDAVRVRYKPLLGPLKEGDETDGVKVKVKCPGVSYPTSLHHRDVDGRHHKNGGRIEHLTRGAKVVPIVSASYGLWFMGGGTQFGLSLQAEDMIIIPGDTPDDSLGQFPTSAPLVMASKTDETVPADETVQKSLTVELLGAAEETGAM